MTTDHVSEKDPRYPMTRVTFTSGRTVTYHRTVAHTFPDRCFLYQVGSGRRLPFLSFSTAMLEVVDHFPEPS